MVQKFRDILKNAVIMRNDTALFAVLGIRDYGDSLLGFGALGWAGDFERNAGGNTLGYVTIN